MMQIGAYTIDSPVVLAPMAGVTDMPFRKLCRQMGAGLAVSEMISANALLWKNKKTQQRLVHADELAPRSVQIAGTEPEQLAKAAQINQEQGAQIIDINMGCPAKKVCQVLAGSALLKDEAKVAAILQAVVAAVSIPVTLKIRTGWDKSSRNGVMIAKIAEQAGVQALAVHGRTRACAYRGEAEYDTIAEIKQNICIPVIANGDISSPEKARYVLDYTKADAVMIGRAAQGNPWIFAQIKHYLARGERLKQPDLVEVRDTLLAHLKALHDFYGEYTGVRIARKHLAWYSKRYQGGATFRQHINQLKTSSSQYAAVMDFFSRCPALNA